MPTPSLNNGIFLADRSVAVGSHLDSYHLMNMLGESKPTDLGPVDLWAMAQKVEMPLYQMSNFGGKNVIEVDNPRGEFKWQIPVAQDLPYVTEDIEAGNTTKGIDGQTFRIKLNKRAFSHTDLITYDKYNGAEMYITDEDITPAGDGWIYTVQLVNNDNFRYLDNKYLKSGTKIFRAGSARGEYGERFADINASSGFREFYNYLSTAEADVHYTISSRADLMLRGGVKGDGTMAVTELWRNFDKNLDPSVSDLSTMVSIMGKDYVKKAMENGSLSRSFITNLEAACLTKIGNDIEYQLMWGKGGKISRAGQPDDMRLSVGLWKQLDNSYKRIYNKATFTLDLFKSEIFNFFNGKVEFKGPDPKRKLVVQTGMAGMKLINAAIQREVAGSGLVVNGSQIGAISGSAMNLNFGYSYTQYVIPFLANMEFVINPAFDNVHTNDIENPIIDGFPLSSYSFIIFDITDNNNDNIFLLKKKWDSNLKWWYQNGTADYKGATNGFVSSGNFNGYKVFMTQALPSVWVRDPTRVLKIVMKNPITGGSY